MVGRWRHQGFCGELLDRQVVITCTNTFRYVQGGVLWVRGGAELAARGCALACYSVHHQYVCEPRQLFDVHDDVDGFES